MKLYGLKIKCIKYGLCMCGSREYKWMGVHSVMAKSKLAFIEDVMT